MEYFCQFFAEPRDVVRIYLATGEERYKAIAEEKLGRPLLKLDEFAKQKFATFARDRFRLISSDGWVYARDASRNYMKMKIEQSTLEVVEAYVADANAFADLSSFVEETFAEIVGGTAAISIRRTRAQVELANGSCVEVPFDGFAVYESGIVHTLCDNANCTRYVV